MDHSMIHNQLYKYNLLPASGRFIITDNLTATQARIEIERDISSPPSACSIDGMIQSGLYAATMNALTTLNPEPAGPQSIDLRELFNDGVNIVGSVEQQICADNQDVCRKAINQK